MSMINIPVWMFLSSYERLREKILINNTLISMVHPGRGIFGSDFGSVSFVISKYSLRNYKGTYHRLFDNQGEVKSVEEREKSYLNGKGVFHSQQESFSKIPGSPIAYWLSDKFIKAFEKGVLLGMLADSKQGIATADNNRFLRLWYEVENISTKYDAENQSDAELSNKKWFPYNKGGEFRKWYGNNDYVVNWENNGSELRNFKKSVLRNPNYYFKECFSWSLVSSSVAAFRYKPKGHIFDVAGMSCFSDRNLEYLLALCNTNVVMEILKVIAPTINYQCGDIANIPVIMDEAKKERIELFAKENIQTSKTDWDSFETSWDFRKHPLVPLARERQEQESSQFANSRMEKFGLISWHYDNWEQECNDRFNQLKANEEELNRIFIDIYGLQDELTSDVDDKDITVRKADLQREIKSLISYAVGCMLGRYSLDVDGVAYAGGEWNNAKYSTFIPDSDNCLMITDEEYLEGEDIVSKFVEFVKVVYGDETLEENLEFIAKALGNKGNSSREIIRNYFLNDFIADHNKLYQKRPIYWQFDSGKQNGFKAICYMHRWNEDTIGNMRVEYLHRMQKVYENELLRMQEIIDSSSDNKEISNATKRKEKLQKQLKETKDYDAKVAHLALSRIGIDLDDGVKVNYEKVQTAPDGTKMEILTKIK